MESPIIKVFTPCSCPRTETVDFGYGSFTRPRKWWQCTCDSVLIASYECHECFDGIEGAPTPQAVDRVRALHPGADLVYLRMFGEAVQS